MCSYNCSAPAPPLMSDNDINGIGVIVNYLATAGIAVLVILIYYFAVYEPARDAFIKLEHSGTATPFRPNPVDVVLLRWVRYLPRKLMGALRIGVRNPARLENTFTKCFLAMSDLQIVTGFSILISGFAQFPCGLATYYWMLIVELAWFSSLTHLSCLTLLRSHLYSRSSERAWRLFAMGAMAGLLVIGLGFTGRYAWAYELYVSEEDMGPGPLDHAICYLDVAAENTYTFWSMVFSVALIIMAFVSRIVKLHRTLSVTLIGRAREYVGIKLRKLLRVVDAWSNRRTNPGGLKNLLCYRPMFAIYLAFRALLDGWTSMGVEVGWLLLAFCWGITRLMTTINYQKHSPSLNIEDDDSGDWSFGQVVAMVLLAAPIITIFEYFDHNSQNDNATTVHADIVEMLPHSLGYTSSTSGLNEEAVVDLDDPDNDWHQMPNTAAVTFIFSFMVCILMSLFFFIFGAFDNAAPIRALSRLFSRGYIALSLPMLVLVILHSLLIQTTFKRSSPRTSAELLNVSGHMVLLAMGRFLPPIGTFLPLISVALYVFYSVCSQLRYIKLA